MTQRTRQTRQTYFNRFDWCRQRRAETPVHVDDDGVWHVYRFPDVQQVINDHETFSSNVPFGENLLGESIIRLDPPRHRQLRKLANKGLTARRIAELEPRIAVITDELMAATAGRDEIEVVADLAVPLPGIVMSELLGIEPERREEFKTWSYVFASGEVRERNPAVARALTDMENYFVEGIAQRRVRPKDDLISAVVQAEVDGQRLTESEVLSFCYLLLVAGNESTTSLIGSVAYCLAEFPELLDRLRADPALVPAAVEETLRLLPPVQVLVRLTTKEVRMHGQVIPRGARVMAWNASGNRDETRFPEPDRFDLTRENSRHFGFGYGIHFCLGAPLARIEARIATAALLRRLPGQWLLPDEPLEPVAPFFLCGVTRLPLKSTG